MNAFRFAQPDWIHLLWVVIGLALVLAWLEFRSRSVLDLFVSRVMQPRLVQRASLVRRAAALALICLAMVLLVFALMRPQWGTTVQRTLRVDSQLMVCLDVSNSMLAEDVAPNRLERAKIEVDALLGLLSEGEQVGLIAFAGKATVLCPMTTDFGFLRLILHEAEPSTVGLGGTQIGVAISKALEGFREAGDMNRLILLLTDGEDHDSFPLQAADSAKERGVKIVSVGFGDEAGSKIEITDPQTGARSFVKDRSGQEVLSRLDGETLREMALRTEGAYIPAGTGALDLESIYRTHIATLLRGATDSQQQVVRHEAYQWLVLAALIALSMGLALATRFRLGSPGTELPALPGPAHARAAVWMAGLLLAGTASRLAAQPPATAPTDDVAAAATDAEIDGDSPDAALPSPRDAAELAPRAAYNRALALIQSDPSQAEQYLNLARRDAGRDGELRYRTLYNLGWVEVARADGELPDQPEQALTHLQQAANRFREAIRIRPHSAEARHNLEIVSRRILELTDALARKDPTDLAQRLDQLIDQLRAHQAELQVLVQQTGEEVDAAQVETYRADFRRLGATQRQILAEVQRFSEAARQELDAANAKSGAETPPAERLRAGQLTNLLRFLDSSIQRLSQSRSLTRRLQGNRAFRRWAAGLSDAKRARDQLRNPVELIGQLLGDTTELVSLTRALAAARTQLGDESQQDADAQREPTGEGLNEEGDGRGRPSYDKETPVWLTREYLEDLQAATLERTRELEQLLSSVHQAGSDASPAAPDTPETSAPDARTQQLLDNIGRALPSLQSAVARFEKAAAELAAGSLEPAAVEQLEALAALAEAWEWFAGLRRLIELTYQEEQLVRNAIQKAPDDPAVVAQVAAAIMEAQHKNRNRATRLDDLLRFELQQLSEPSTSPSPLADPQTANAPAAGGEPASDEGKEAELARVRRAQELLTGILAQLDRVLPPLDALAAEPSPADSSSRDPRWSEAEAAADEALVGLDELRRLFFSLVEHLRDTAQRQAELHDQTTQQSTEPPASQTATRLGPLAHRQGQLEHIAQAIAEALAEQGAAAQSQSGQAAPATSTPPDTQGATQEDMAQALTQAAELVGAAHTAMTAAAGQLDALSAAETIDPATEPFRPITDQQQAALQKLAEAIALLEPPQSSPRDQNQDGQGQNQPTDSENQDREDQQQQNLSASQMLQLIRDREAQRREDRKRQGRAAADVVDKDW